MMNFFGPGGLLSRISGPAPLKTATIDFGNPDFRSLMLPAEEIFSQLESGSAPLAKLFMPRARQDELLARHGSDLSLKLFQGLNGIEGAREYYEGQRLTAFSYLPDWGRGPIHTIVKAEFQSFCT